MDIIVCIKQVQDPDIPPRDFKVDEERMDVIPPVNVSPVINGFCENAVEAAIHLKEKHGGKITVMTVGDKKARDGLKKCLAMGCDDAILLMDDAFDGSDAFGTARILASAIQKLDSFDVVLCGRLSSDWSYGTTALALAEALEVPSVSQLQKAEKTDTGLRCERVLEDGLEVIEVATPCLLTASNEINTPRLPSVKGILMASRKQIPVWGAEDIGIDRCLVGKEATTFEITKLYQPVFDGNCEFIEGESLEEAAGVLALRLREDKII